MAGSCALRQEPRPPEATITLAVSGPLERRGVGLGKLPPAIASTASVSCCYLDGMACSCYQPTHALGTPGERPPAGLAPASRRTREGRRKMINEALCVCRAGMDAGCWVGHRGRVFSKPEGVGLRPRGTWTGMIGRVSLLGPGNGTGPWAGSVAHDASSAEPASDLRFDVVPSQIGHQSINLAAPTPSYYVLST